MKVLLVDDQELVRTGFRLILSVEPDIDVVGEASDGLQAVERVGDLDPDVVLMDVQMPGLDGIEATRRIVATGRAKVIILTTFDRDDYLFDALRAGASGFMLKNAPAESLVDGLRRVASGYGLLAPEVTRRVIESSLTGGSAAHDDRLAELTERETQIVKQVARGLSNGEIAETLFISEATVKTHVSACLAKLDLRDRVQLAVFAYESGLIRAGESG